MTPKPVLLAVLMVILLPLFSFSQQFSASTLLNSSDQDLFLKELTRSSPVLQNLAATANLKIKITPEEARALVKEKLKELNDPNLNKLYEKVDDEGETSIGVVLHILMNGLSDDPDLPDVDEKSKVGGGVGVYIMWQLANFLLMPELTFLMRSFGEKSGSTEITTKFTQLALTFTALYIIRASTLSFVIGVSPGLAYALSGKYVFDNDEKEDVEFGGDHGANRLQALLAATAGILFRNRMMLRLSYYFGVSKVYSDADQKMFMLALSMYVPFTVFSGGKK